MNKECHGLSVAKGRSLKKYSDNIIKLQCVGFTLRLSKCVISMIIFLYSMPMN